MIFNCFFLTSKILKEIQLEILTEQHAWKAAVYHFQTAKSYKLCYGRKNVAKISQQKSSDFKVIFVYIL